MQTCALQACLICIHKGHRVANCVSNSRDNRVQSLIRSTSNCKKRWSLVLLTSVCEIEENKEPQTKTMQKESKEFWIHVTILIRHNAQWSNALLAHYDLQLPDSNVTPHYSNTSACQNFMHFFFRPSTLACLGTSVLFGLHVEIVGFATLWCWTIRPTWPCTPLCRAAWSQTSLGDVLWKLSAGPNHAAHSVGSILQSIHNHPCSLGLEAVLKFH